MSAGDRTVFNLARGLPLKPNAWTFMTVEEDELESAVSDLIAELDAAGEPCRRITVVADKAAWIASLQDPPNSYVGGNTFGVRPDAAYMDEAEIAARLSALEEHYGFTGEELIAKTASPEFAWEPEFAEWLVLLGRGDLVP